MTVVAERTLSEVYPTDWESFIGQESAKRQLMIACRAAKMRQVPLAHVLLASGEAGLGKTALALLCAEEMGRNIKVVSGKVGANEARIILAEMQDGDILVVDEIHRLVVGGKATSEWLLHYLQDGILMGPLGAEECPRVTVIGATTDAGRLPETVLSRFPIRPMLTGYADEEAADIALVSSPRIFAGMHQPSAHNCEQIALAANNNPRQITAIMCNVRDIAVATDYGNYNPETETYDITEALGWMGLSEDGLDRTCRRYLVLLKTKFRDGAGESALKDALQEPGGLGATERVLMNKGFIAKTKTGRVLLAPGVRRATDLMNTTESL